MNPVRLLTQLPRRIAGAALLALLAAWVLAAPLHAQESGVARVVPITFGDTVTGRLDGESPAVAYSFDGLRGEYLRIALTVTRGDLDATLALFAPDGSLVVQRDDSADPRTLTLQLRLTRSGVHRLVAARFGHGIGSTAGDFTLAIDRVGVSAESGSALRFGDTVANSISDAQPEVYYSFRARRGDLVSLALRRDSGSLDPLLQIVDANRRILIQIDDTAGSPDARIERWLVPDDAQYLIVATRYGGPGGTTNGTFLLTLDRVPESALGNSADAAIRLFDGRPDERELTAERYQNWYVFEARGDDLVTLSLNRIGGSLDPFLVLLDSAQNELATHDDLVDGEQRDSLISGYRIPHDGLYYVLATRFERQAGTTIGRYRLTLTREGNAFDTVDPEIERITYNSSVGGVLTAAITERRFAFYGNGGDTITAVVNRVDGDLAPTIRLIDEAGGTILEGNSAASNAVIPRITLPASGLYTLVVGRASGSGGFILALAQRTE
ncbi:MAG: PPC domain-containing protein [Chloroflexi bacterium]|nr:PPC domain-containing protein [Chloroflexota bacterium]